MLLCDHIVNVAEAKCLQALVRENAALKRLVGDLAVGNWMLKDVLGKKW